ncbi:MAG: VWA domain-containing protein [Bacteroidota bacterium]
MKRSIILFALFMVINHYHVMAQRGYSSASVTMNRANGVISPNQVIVEEYLNYHLHRIGIPTNGKEIALSLDYTTSGDDEVILQAGIATRQLLDFSNMPPANVSLVIDCSGSMQSDNKLGKVKKALHKFITGLRSEDYISIVAYSSQATVIQPAVKAGEISNIDSIIESLVPGGSTNLHEGLMFGYKEVQKNLLPNGTNKVVLLTDGIANRGVVDPEKIVSNSGAYNQEGIDVSTIGVGRNINYSLLQQIARQGRGSNHFVGDHQEDIVKVFDTELESLISIVAKQASLVLEYPKSISVEDIYGYTPQYGENTISIPLNNLNLGMTQVVLYKLKLENTNKRPLVKARLVYSDSKSGQQRTISNKTSIAQGRKITNSEVLKNLYIAKMAQSLKDMATELNNRNPDAAKVILNEVLDDVDAVFPRLKDKDMLRVRDILVSNQKKLERI